MNTIDRVKCRKTSNKCPRRLSERYLLEHGLRNPWLAFIPDPVFIRIRTPEPLAFIRDRRLFETWHL